MAAKTPFEVIGVTYSRCCHSIFTPHTFIKCQSNFVLQSKFHSRSHSYGMCDMSCALMFFFSAEHEIFGEVSSSDDEVNILDNDDDVSGPMGFRADDTKDPLDLGFAEAAATLDPDVCKSSDTVLAMV